MSKSPFLESVRQVIRTRHLSIRTEQAYVAWIRRFIAFNGMRHPAEMGADEVSRFLSYLANRRNVASATQNQALNALVFLYRDALKRPLGDVSAVRARKQRRLPVVLTQGKSIDSSGICEAKSGFRQH